MRAIVRGPRPCRRAGAGHSLNLAGSALSNEKPEKPRQLCGRRRARAGQLPDGGESLAGRAIKLMASSGPRPLWVAPFGLPSLRCGGWGRVNRMNESEPKKRKKRDERGGVG